MVVGVAVVDAAVEGAVVLGGGAAVGVGNRVVVAFAVFGGFVASGVGAVAVAVVEDFAESAGEVAGFV